MRFAKTAFLALALSFGLSPALADEMPAADRAAMDARVDSFNAAFASGNFASVFDYMPPPVLAALASQSGMTEAELLDATRMQIEAAMKSVTLESFRMDTDAATYRTTPDGSRGYALIPTETVMKAEGVGRIRATSETLAFADGGEWYLVRIDEPAQVQLLQTAYPEFQGVAFTSGRMEAIE